MRKDTQKAGPSGMSRNDAFTLFESWGGKNCLLSIDYAPIKAMKEALGGESILDFVSVDYAQQAEVVYNNLGIIRLNMENVWTVFQDLLHGLHPGEI